MAVARKPGLVQSRPWAIQSSLMSCQSPGAAPEAASRMRIPRRALPADQFPVDLDSPLRLSAPCKGPRPFHGSVRHAAAELRISRERLDMLRHLRRQVFPRGRRDVETGFRGHVFGDATVV